MPPSKIRVIPRRASSAPEAEPIAATAAPAPVKHEQNARRPLSVLERLREHEGRLLTARTLAEILGYDNVKRVYELPIGRFPLGPGGERALRWDPASVISWLEERHEPPPHSTAAFLRALGASPPMNNADLAKVLAVPRSAITFMQLPPRNVSYRGHDYWSGDMIAEWLASLVEYPDQWGVYHGR